MQHMVEQLVGGHLRNQRSHRDVSTTNHRFHPEPLHHLESEPGGMGGYAVELQMRWWCWLLQGEAGCRREKEQALPSFVALISPPSCPGRRASQGSWCRAAEGSRPPSPEARAAPRKARGRRRTRWSTGRRGPECRPHKGGRGATGMLRSHSSDRLKPGQHRRKEQLPPLVLGTGSRSSLKSPVRTKLTNPN
jgi:hypothetical protein